MKNQNINSWKALTCPYFASVCRKALSEYLEHNNFVEVAVNEINGLIFSRFGVFLEISYELESAPNYWLSVVLGVGEHKYDTEGNPCCVPYWYLLPSDRPEHQGKMIQFRNESELETLLSRFKNDFFEIYAKPLWLNPDYLEKMIVNFRFEHNC